MSTPAAAGLLAALPQVLQLFGRVIVLDHGHHLDRSEELVGGDLPRRAEVGGERFEPLAQPPLHLDLFPQARDVEADHLQRREAGPVQAVADLLQREAELPQRQHLLQAGDVAGRVEAVSRLGVQRRLQQADLVVMVQRADGQARPPRQLAHLQGLEPHGDPSCRRLREQRPRRNGTTSRYVRIKGSLAKKREEKAAERRLREGSRRTAAITWKKKSARKRRSGNI